MTKNKTGNTQLQKLTITEEQSVNFAQYISAGMALEQAAKQAQLPFSDISQLFDVLQNSNLLTGALTNKIHKEICTIGKDLAWRVLKELMRNPETPATSRLAAAKWTLEASGEGIGSTRNQRKPNKQMHEMSNAELNQVMAEARTIIEGKAIDVTPRDEYEGLFD